MRDVEVGRSVGVATTVSVRGAWLCEEETSESVKCEGCVVSGSCDATLRVMSDNVGPEDEDILSFTSTTFLIVGVASCGPTPSSSSCIVRTVLGSTNDVMIRVELPPFSDRPPSTHITHIAYETKLIPLGQSDILSIYTIQDIIPIPSNVKYVLVK